MPEALARNGALAVAGLRQAGLVGLGGARECAGGRGADLMACRGAE